MTQEQPQILDSNETQKVAYCIPNWLRDEQMKASMARIKARVLPAPDANQAMAIVCYGPSLNDTWEQVKKFRFVMTCSGAHKFMIDRGVVPTHHVEVDPRAHKAKLIGQPHPDVEYLISSTCHAAVWDLLEGFDAKLWNVFDPNEDAMRTLPQGEWAVMGGCSVGLRAITLARFLGFKRLHVFGMDGNIGSSGVHAAEHPNQPQTHCLTTVNGREFRTTPALLEAARQTWHELDQMTDVQATFYGDGLVQEMSKTYVRKEGVEQKQLIGIVKPETISVGYRDMNRKMHETNHAYGVGGGKHADTVMKLHKATNAQSVLDYGCGKGYLAKKLPFPIWEYDPAIPEKSVSPRRADLVVCTDVLEHVEPELLFQVLDDLARCTKKVGYFTINTAPARKTLPDGRNTHLIQKDETWWRSKLKKFFAVGSIQAVGPELHVIVGPKIKPKEKANGKQGSEDRSNQEAHRHTEGEAKAAHSQAG